MEQPTAAELLKYGVAVEATNANSATAVAASSSSRVEPSAGGGAGGGAGAGAGAGVRSRVRSRESVENAVYGTNFAGERGFAPLRKRVKRRSTGREDNLVRSYAALAGLYGSIVHTCGKSLPLTLLLCHARCFCYAVGGTTTQC